MNLQDIDVAVTRDDKPEIRRAFRALVNYPNEEPVDGDPRQFADALRRICGSLLGDTAIMPGSTFDSIKREAQGLLRSGDYHSGARAVLRVEGVWIARFDAGVSD